MNEELEAVIVAVGVLQDFCHKQDMCEDCPLWNGERCGVSEPDEWETPFRVNQLEE